MKKFFAALLIVLHMHLSGCVSVQTVAPEYLKYDESKPLRLGMNDGSTIRLSPGSYHVQEHGDSLVIVGNGLRYETSKARTATPFAGTIRSGEIAKIETVEPSDLVFVLPIYIGAVTALGLVILLSFHGSSVVG